MYTYPEFSPNNDDEENESNENGKENQDENNIRNDSEGDQITDLTLSEFLKQQQEKQQSSKSSLLPGGKITGGIRDRVKRWFKNPSEGDEPDSNSNNDPSPPVQPIRLDGSTAPNEDEAFYLDEPTRARITRQEQKAKRMKKIMEELQNQVENSPEDLVKNIENEDVDQTNAVDNQDNSIGGQSQRQNVIRPNFDKLLEGVPGLNDLLGDSPPAENPHSTTDNGGGNNDFGPQSNQDQNQNYPRLNKHGSISYDSFLSSSGNRDSPSDDKTTGKKDKNKEDPSIRQEFLRREQEMRKRAGLTSRPDKQKQPDDFEQGQTPTSSQDSSGNVKSRGEINLEALNALEGLRRKRFGDKYTEPDNIKSIRDSSAASYSGASTSNLQENEEAEKEESPEMRFKRMEQEMRRKTGLTTRPDKKEEDSQKSVNDLRNFLEGQSKRAKDPKKIREELSNNALTSLEKLRRNKLGDAYTELDKEQIMQKMKEIAEKNEVKSRDLMQNDDTFLGDDEIASWAEGNTNFDNTYVDKQLSDAPSQSETYDSKIPGEKKQDKKGLDLFKKKTTASDQIYRTIAAKSGGNTNDEKRSEWENFLAKEQEMREKMGMIDNVKDKLSAEAGVEKPNTAFFTEQNEGYVDDTYQKDQDVIEDDYKRKDDFFDMEDRKESSLSSQIYRSIASKKGARDRGTEADFEAYFKREAEMRKKMGMASLDEEKPDTSRTVDLSSVFQDTFNDVAVKNRKDETFDEPVPNSPFYKNDENHQNDDTNDDSSDDIELSTEEWLKAKEASLNMNENDNINDGDYSSDVDNWIRNKEEPSQGDKIDDENHNIQEKTNTTFLQDFMNDDIEEKIEEKDNDEITREQTFRTSSKYTYDPADLSDIFSRDIFPEKDVYVDKGGSQGFSSYNARKNDLLDSTELSVQELNALGEFDPMARLSMKLKPDSAFGSIFRLEGTLVDTTEMHMEAWTKVAEQYGFEPPSWEEVQKAQLIKADEAVRSIFFWSYDLIESRDIALSHYDALQEIFGEYMKKHDDTKSKTGLSETQNYLAFSTPRPEAEDPESESTPIFTVTEGAIEWLERLRDVNMPCAVMSQLDRTKLDTILHATHLDEFFPEDRRVSANCGYNRESQEMLGAALRIQRRPDHCVVFDTSPSSSVAAHDVEMKSVALMGLFAMYELNTADMAVPGFDELSVINVRRLFSAETFDEPQLELEKQKPQRDTNVRTTWAEGDRY